jgi:LysM repeat protein
MPLKTRLSLLTTLLAATALAAACEGPQAQVGPDWTPVIIFVSPTPEAASGEPTPRAPNVPTTAYRIKPGETLAEIADRYGLSTEELAALNGITNPNRVEVGQDIRVPTRPVAP